MGVCAKSLQSLQCYGLYIVLWTAAPLWTAVAPQAPLSTGFSRQENWSELPFPSTGDLFNPGTQPMSPVSPALAGGVFSTGTSREAPGQVVYRTSNTHFLFY